MWLTSDIHEVWVYSVSLDVGVAYSPREFPRGDSGGDVGDVEFSPDGGRVAVSTGNAVLVLSTEVPTCGCHDNWSSTNTVVVCRAGYWTPH